MITKPERRDIKQLENRGWSQINHKSYDKALDTFSKILELEPDNEAGFQGKAASLRLKGLTPQALHILGEGLKLYPRSIGLLSESAWLYIGQKRYTDALKMFDRILEINNTDPSHFLWKIYLLREQQQPEEAIATLSVAERIFPDDVRFINEWGWLFFGKGMYEDAMKAFDRTLIIDPLNQTALQGKLASMRKEGLYEDFNDLIQRVPPEISNNVSIRSEQGWLYFEQRMYDEAVREFKQIITLLPDDPNIYMNLVWTLVKRGRNEDLLNAAAYCRQAISIEPSLAQAYGALGVIAFKQDRLHEAEAYLLHSIQLDPKMGYYVDLGALYIKMGRFDEAEKYLKEALDFNNQDAYLHNQLGYLYLETDRTGEAIKEFRRAVSLDPRQAEYHRAYAIALSENDNYAEAEAALRKALKLIAPHERWQIHLTLAQLLTRMANISNDPLLYQRALEEANIAYTLHPREPSVSFQNGIIRYKLKDYHGALGFFQKCLKENKDHLEADLNVRRLEAILRQERTNERASRPERIAISLFLIAQIVALWYLYLVGHNVSETAVTVLIPILFGLLIVSVMLPWLNRIKLTGLEAELSEPKPKESLDLGPRGDAFITDHLFDSDRKL